MHPPDRPFSYLQPIPLPPWAVYFFAPQIGLLCVYHVFAGLFGDQPPLVALRWGVFSTALSFLVLAAPPLLRPLLGRGPRHDWWIFVGVYGGLAVSIATLRSLLAPWAIGIPLPFEMLRNLVGSMIVTLTISVAGMEALVSRIAHHEAWQRELKRLQDELAASRSRLLRQDDALRREAAEYLHGEIQSRLLMAWALLDQARSHPHDGQQPIEAARAQIAMLRQESLAQARLLMDIVDRPLLDRLGELIDRYQAVLPVTLELAPGVPEQEAALSDALRTAAHHMVEEGLLNAFRHAMASRVAVRLHLSEPGRLALEVCDDGIGFDPRTAAKGLGLSGLGDALQALGGSWRLDTAPGEGSCLLLMLPLSAPRPLEAR